MNWLLMILLVSLAPSVSAWGWQDLLQTKDQQAKEMMDSGQFAKAHETFLREDWRAASAYRAGDYAKAATLYSAVKHIEDAHYNQGNALARLGKYQQAINEYNKTLAMNPNHDDAIANRKLVEELLKKQQDQDKQNQDKQDQDKRDQDKQDQDKQEQDKQEQDKKDQDKKDQDKKDQDKKDQDKKEPKNEKQSRSNQENEQSREQWLRLVPDDPGGLLREKFLRDHIRRQNGWTE